MLQSLHLRNFRIHMDTRINFDRVNWFVGPSRAGKSSILAGLELAMTAGFNQWTDGKGSGKDTQTGNYGKDMLVGYTFNGVSTEIKVPSKAQVSPLMDAEIIRACLRPRYFINLSTSKQKDLVSKVFSPKIDVKKALNEYSSQSDLGDRFWVWLKNTHSMSIDSPIPEMYKVVYEERRVIKKELEALKSQVAAYEKKPTLWMPAESARKIITKYNELCLKAAQLEESIRSSNDENANIINEKERLESLRKELAETEAVIQTSANNIQEEPEDMSEILGGSLAKLEKDIKMAIKAKEKLAVAGKCPPGECRYEKISIAQAKIDDLYLQREKVRADIKEFVDKKNMRTHFIQSFEAMQQRHENIKTQIETIERFTSKAGAVSTKDKEAEFSTLKKEIEEMRKDYETATENLAASGATEVAAKSLQEDIEDVQEQWQLFDVLCNALGPNGIKSSDDQTYKDFIALINDFLKQFKVTVSLQKDDLFFSKDGSLYTVPVEQASWSEQGLISAAIQSSFAKKSGLNIFAVDEHGMDPGMRLDLYETIFEDPYDVQSIILSTMSEVDSEGCLIEPTNPGDEGVKIFLVNNGTVIEILPEG